jgi:hypothetical protein
MNVGAFGVMTMASGDHGHRELCKRQHRVIAAYLVMRAWKAGADYVVIERRALEQWLDLERFKQVRLDWFISDVGPWFPFSETVFHSTSGQFSAAYLSRKALDNWVPGAHTNDVRMTLLAAQGLIGIIFRRWNISRATIELTAIHELTDIANGLSDFSHFDIPSRSPEHE